MRHLLVAHARQHGALKRCGGAETLDLAGVPEPSAAPDVDLSALDAALTELATLDARQSRIVELRFFGGYTIEETAELVGCSPATVSREWQLAHIWLFRQMREGASGA